MVRVPASSDPNNLLFLIFPKFLLQMSIWHHNIPTLKLFGTAEPQLPIQKSSFALFKHHASICQSHKGDLNPGPWDLRSQEFHGLNGPQYWGLLL